jgi:hypothetical protein
LRFQRRIAFPHGCNSRLVTVKTVEVISVPTQKIEDHARSKSGMPEDVSKGLTKRDLRDLVESLSKQVTPADPTKH